VSLGIDIDHDVEVAIGPVLAPRDRTEHGGMGTPRARKTLSWRRRVARASRVFMVEYIARPGGRGEASELR
jgi:hypothetical protein